MKHVSRSLFREAAIAMLLVAVAFVLRAYVLRWALQETVPYLVFLAAVIGAAYYGGWRSGVMATLMGAAVCAFLVAPPYVVPRLYDPSHLVRLPLFIATGLLFCIFTQRMRSAQRRAEANERALRAQEQRKDEFLSTLAHELRNPLAVIGSAVDVMKVGGRETSDVDKLRSIIDRQVQQLVRLIDDLIDVARISRGALALKKQTIDLRTAVDAAIEAVQPMLSRFEHELTVKQNSRPLIAEADAARVNQIVANLLSNAAKYTPSGGHLRLTTSEQGEEAVICVEDNGIGIAAEDLPRIFDMYAQLGQSLQRDEGGLGIGLTVVKRLVQMHGGTITAHSDGPGRGSRFTVFLPLDAGRLTAAPPLSASEGADAQTAFRVLLVEDDPDGAELFGRLLAMMGHEVEIAANAGQALEIAPRFFPEIVFSDIDLPDMSGYDLAARLRQMDPVHGAYLVAVTGYATAHERQQALRAGFDEHLVKPVSLARLRTLLSQLPMHLADRGAAVLQPSPETHGRHLETRL